MARPRGSTNKKGPKKGTKKDNHKPRAAFTAPVNTKTGAAGDAATGGVSRAEAIVRRVTPAATLKDLLKTCRGLKQNMDEINGSLREKIGFAKDKKHLHTKAFALLRQFHNMEAEKACEYWHTLVRYMELTGIMEKIDSVGHLPLEAPADENPGAEVEAGEAGAGDGAPAGGEAEPSEAAEAGGENPESETVVQGSFGSRRAAAGPSTH